MSHLRGALQRSFQGFPSFSKFFQRNVWRISSVDSCYISGLADVRSVFATIAIFLAASTSNLGWIVADNRNSHPFRFRARIFSRLVSILRHDVLRFEDNAATEIPKDIVGGMRRLSHSIRSCRWSSKIGPSSLSAGIGSGISGPKSHFEQVFF